ncbi:hypothetical protein [Nocardia yamanashiensis]|uniref:hypothetical protein n=1 Tax=Nocardia yamanashiensis TaxID=209247 RepID=UPI00082A527A|nr:hypothetical protein [Nocardia yamanashiensis]
MKRAVIAAIAGLLVLLDIVVGVAIPPRAGVIATDRLGPDYGERIDDYLLRARNSLQGNDTGAHWALLSFTAAVTADSVPGYAAGHRISEVDYHVAIDRVATPIVSIGVPAGEAVAVKSIDAAGYLVTANPSYDERSARVQQVVAARLHAHCACVVGVVVHAPLPDLRNMADRPGIRAIEALPADASAGVFAVSPLLPEYSATVTASPDDGPVPAN